MSVLEVFARNPAALPVIATLRGARYQLAAIALVMLLLLAVAWSIDLADKFADVRNAAEARGAPLLSVLAPYMLYRAVDIVTRLLPVACFVAVFAAEIAPRRRLESVVHAAAGMSPLQSLAPAFLAAAVVGGAQLGLESWWRPAAVFAQVDLGVGSYADRFRRGVSSQREWFLSGHDAISGLVVSQDEPELREVELFRGFSDDRLEQVVLARKAEPAEIPGRWLLLDAVVWDRQAGGDTYEPRRESFIEVDFAMIPDQLTYFDVPGFYLPNGPLHRLAGMRALPAIADMDLAIWRRWSAFFLPGAFVLLGATLARNVWSGRMVSFQRVALYGLAGYAAVLSVKILWSMGEQGAIPASFAACAPIAAALAAAATIQFIRS